MRAISQEMSLNRKPRTNIIIRDVLLRWTDFLTNAYSTNYPALVDADDIPQCYHDVDNVGGIAYRSWMASATAIYTIATSPMDSAIDWVSDAHVTTGTPGNWQRMSQYGSDTFYGDGGTLRKNSGDYKTNAYTVDDGCVAFAAVSATEVFFTQLHILCDFRYLSFHRYDGSTLSECPHTICVPTEEVPEGVARTGNEVDYNEASLSWFDAEIIGGRTVIIANERIYGHPVVILYEDGVWTTPSPMLPQDIVDNFSFLRVGHLSKMVDYSGNEVLLATGRLGRKGSTGAHAQEWDVLMRSRDGEHWTIDRYSYICADAMVTKILEYDGYVYYPAGATIKHAPRSWLLGGDPEQDGDQQYKWELEQDLLSWSYSQPKAGSPASGTTAIATHNGIYTPYKSTGIRYGIHPGYWLWRYAHYTSKTTGLLSTETIDKVIPSYKAGDRMLSTQSRGSSSRLLIDWSSDQDWQWLSQIKHHDDCDQMDALYSIGASMIDVQDISDYGISGEVEEVEVNDEEEGENNGLRFSAKNKPGIFLSTEPFDARNFIVRHRFSFDNEYGVDVPYGLGNSLFLDTGDTGLTFGDTTFQKGSGVWTWLDWLHINGPNTAPVFDNYYEMITVITAIHTDGCISWGFLGAIDDVVSTKINVHTQPIHAIDAVEDDNNYRGWNGASVTGKSPARYFVSFLPEKTRLGYGAGVVGCVKDKNNLIAAFFDIIGPPDGVGAYNDNELNTKGQFTLMARRPYTYTEDDEDVDSAIWLPIITTEIDTIGSYTFNASKEDLYEVEMRRDGRNIEARLLIYYKDSSTTTVINAASLEHNWSGNGRMIPGDSNSDLCKVGIITNVQVAECRILPARDNDKYIARQYTYHWPRDPDPDANYSNNDIPRNYVDSQNQWPWDDFRLFREDANTPLYINGEKMAIMHRTASNYRAYYYWLYNKYNPDVGPPKVMRFVWGNSLNAPPTYYTTWDNDGSGFAHIAYAVDGAGIGALGKIKSYAIHSIGGAEYKFSDDPSGDNRTMTDEDYLRMKSNLVPDHYKNSNYTFIMTTTGFEVSRPIENRRSHPHGSIARSHFEDAIMIRGVWAYDGEYDKTLEWTLQDIATKTGVLDYEFQDSISNSSLTLPNQAISGSTGPYWLQRNGSDAFQRDFDITITLSQAIASGQAVGITCRASSTGNKWDAGTGWDSTSLNNMSAVLFAICADGDGPYIMMQQTKVSSSQWVTLTTYRLDSSMTGKRIRVVGFRNHVALYINDCWAYTFHIGSVFGDTVDDGYSPALDNAGYIGLHSYGVAITADIRQPELFSWTDGIILDQKMNAASGMKRAIKDKRIKWLARADGTLAISYFDNRADLGTITDTIYSDKSAPTDRIPTHIRSVGEEICDYLDHDAAAEYGVTFAVINTPWLDEEEAYLECTRASRDSRSYGEARQLHAAGRLAWEPEDQIKVDYTPRDNGPTICADYIVTSTKMTYKPGDLTSTASLRKKIV